MRRIVQTLAAAAAGIFVTFQVSAQDAGRPNPFAFGVTAGTLGVGAEASFLLTETLVFRANGSYFSVDLTETASSASNGATKDYKFDVNGMFAGAMLDWHPFQGGFRLSAGARYFDVKLKAEELIGRSLGYHDYTAAQVGTVRTSVGNSNPIAPYVGLGYDAAHFTRNGLNFSFGLDIGAMYGGAPKVDITTDRSVAGLSADIAKEKQDLEDTLKKYSVIYPVLMLSGRISF